MQGWKVCGDHIYEARARPATATQQTRQAGLRKESTRIYAEGGRTCSAHMPGELKRFARQNIQSETYYSLYMSCSSPLSQTVFVWKRIRRYSLYCPRMRSPDMGCAYLVHERPIELPGQHAGHEIHVLDMNKMGKINNNILRLLLPQGANKKEHLL